MERVSPEKIEQYYGESVNPRRETSRGLTVHEFVQVAKDTGAVFNVEWYPSRILRVKNDVDEVPPSEAVHVRLRSIQLTTSSLTEINEFIQRLPPGVISEVTETEELHLTYRID